MKTHFHRQLFLVVLLLLTNGCGSFIASRHDPVDYRAFDAAAESGDLASVKTLSDRDPSLVTAPEWGDLTPLHLAVLHNHADVAEYLLTRGADVNARTSTGITPLHEAAQNGNKGIVELLLKWKAKINAVDDKGWSPLARAKRWGHQDVAAFLSARGGRE
ncbi:MAG: ankyrin repeat domain-containing protein [Verrucomicrobiae bacterium]|nr:ankyrin repeat domain-containing protein [Verrucomicrobiae bacterium]